jgi:hypothetical protein
MRRIACLRGEEKTDVFGYLSKAGKLLDAKSTYKSPNPLGTSPANFSLASGIITNRTPAASYSYMIARALPFFVCLCSVVLAQQTPPVQPVQPAQVVSDRDESKWQRMSVGEKIRYDAHHLFDVENFIFAGIGAALDQERDRPHQWGQGWDAYAERYGSHVGQYVVQRTIMSTVRAIDHEDTRFFRSKHTNYGARAGDAFLHTVWRHSDDGGMMPAYSEFFGDYGAAAISRVWWPAQYHTGSAIFIAGSNTILIDGGINLYHEFKPDIKRLLHLEH